MRMNLTDIQYSAVPSCGWQAGEHATGVCPCSWNLTLLTTRWFLPFSRDFKPNQGTDEDFIVQVRTNPFSDTSSIDTINQLLAKSGTCWVLE